MSKYLFFNGSFFSKKIFFFCSNNSSSLVYLISSFSLLFACSYNDIIAVVNSLSKKSSKLSMVNLSKKIFIFSKRLSYNLFISISSFFILIILYKKCFRFFFDLSPKIKKSDNFNILSKEIYFLSPIKFINPFTISITSMKYSSFFSVFSKLYSSNNLSTIIPILGYCS